MPTLDNPLASSMHSIAGFGQTSILPSLPLPYATPPPASTAPQPQSVKLTGAISAMEGPVTACGTSSVLSSMMHSRQLQSITHDSMLGSLQGPMSLHSSAVLAEAAAISSQAVAGQSAMQRSLTEGALELMSNDMNYSALFLHALHDRRMTNILEPYFDEDLHAAPDANEQPLFQSLGADTAIGEPLHVATDFGSGSGSHRALEKMGSSPRAPVGAFGLLERSRARQSAVSPSAIGQAHRAGDAFLHPLSQSPPCPAVHSYAA